MAMSKLITRAAVGMSGNQETSLCKSPRYASMSWIFIFSADLSPFYKFCHKVERKKESIFGPAQKNHMCIMTLKTGETCV